MNTQVTKQTNQYVTDPRQQAFLEAYYSPVSSTYSNAYQSALAVGYSKSTAKDLLHNRPNWLSEKWGDSQVFSPEDLLAKLTDIISDTTVVTRDKLRAIELMMKNRGMLKDRLDVSHRVITIEDVLA